MGRNNIHSLAAIAIIYIATGITSVDCYSPGTNGFRSFKTSQPFQIGRGTKVPNLSFHKDVYPKGDQSSIKDTQNRFSWQLASVTHQEDQSSSPTPQTPHNLNRNFLAIASVILLSIFVAVPNASAIPMLPQDYTSTGFYQSFSLVFLSEIGDKTFFIAGLLAMKSGRLISFLGSILALAGMTILSVLIGQIFHAVPSELTQGLPLDDIAAVLAFTFFGVKTLIEASECDEEGGNCGIDSELADAEEAVEDSGIIIQANTWAKIGSTFGLVFAAEFGDRSFLSTIALSAAQNPVSVALGSILAHAIATGIAVTGGSYIAKYISERTIGYIGGSLFLVFAITTAIGIF